MKFTTTIIKDDGSNACGIEIPATVIESLSAGKKPPISVTIHGKTYRSTVAVMGGKFMVGLNAENRALTGANGGDTVEVDIELDTAPRIVEIPEDLKAALGDKLAAFEKLAPSHRKEHVRAVNDAKTQETRERRIAKVISMMN